MVGCFFICLELLEFFDLSRDAIYRVRLLLFRLSEAWIWLVGSLPPTTALSEVLQNPCRDSGYTDIGPGDEATLVWWRRNRGWHESIISWRRVAVQRLFRRDAAICGVKMTKTTAALPFHGFLAVAYICKTAMRFNLSPCGSLIIRPLRGSMLCYPLHRF